MKKLMNSKMIILLPAAFFLLTSCGPKDESDASSATEPSQPVILAEATVRVQNATVINSDLLLDPAKTENADSLLVSRYLYEGLVTTDASGNIQPGIAQSWVVSDDELDYIFEIRPSARFSDGSQITVDAIEENFNRWFEPENPMHGDGNFPGWLNRFLAFNGERGSDNRAVSQVDGVQKVDINTFIVHLNRLEPQLLNYLAEPAFTILSPTALSTPGYGMRQSTIISSGPYVITSWTDEGMTLSSNPQYWNPVKGEDIYFTWK